MVWSSRAERAGGYPWPSLFPARKGALKKLFLRGGISCIWEIQSSTKIQLLRKKFNYFAKWYKTEIAKKLVFSMLCGILQNDKKRHILNS